MTPRDVPPLRWRCRLTPRDVPPLPDVSASCAAAPPQMYGFGTFRAPIRKIMICCHFRIPIRKTLCFAFVVFKFEKVLVFKFFKSNSKNHDFVCILRCSHLRLLLHLPLHLPLNLLLPPAPLHLPLHLPVPPLELPLEAAAAPPVEHLSGCDVAAAPPVALAAAPPVDAKQQPCSSTTSLLVERGTRAIVGDFLVPKADHLRENQHETLADCAIEP